MDSRIWYEGVAQINNNAWLDGGYRYWFGQAGDEVFIEASVEPSGLAFYARMNQNDCESWIGRFKSEAARVLPNPSTTA